MVNSPISDRIRTAFMKRAITIAAAEIAAAAESLTRSAGSIAADRALPSPGDFYVFDTGDEVGIEWLVVRAHPDDPDLILLAPIDDFPLAGTPDLVLPVERPMTVRCGQTDWFPKSLFTQRLRVGTIPDDVIALVKRRLADLARGRAITPTDPSVDFDPEYEDHMDNVEKARLTLLGRAERNADTPPNELRANVISIGSMDNFKFESTADSPEFALAAEDGSELLTDMERAIRQSMGDKIHEVPNMPGGKLFLIINDMGLRAAWDGPPDMAPVLKSRGFSGEELCASWKRFGPESDRHLTNVIFPYVDGRLTVFIGDDQPQEVAFEL